MLHFLPACGILYELFLDGPLPRSARTSISREEGFMMNAKEIMDTLTKDQIRTDLPELTIGNNVKVYQKITEGNRTRTQMFEGTIIKKQGGGISQTFTVRRLSYGVGVEKTWPVNSPNIERIEISRKGRVRRAKLYYLRDRVGKAAKVKEKI